jgi:hypothetical protein
MLWGAASRVQAQGCGVGVNPIVCENQKAGSPASEWQITGAGDSTIQGFATAFSIAPGETQQFKIDTNASAYTIDIYRMGYYGGFGARLVTSVAPTATLPQNQPNCIVVPSTGLVDCGNWAVSASWPVPADAVSGIYFARLERLDSGGASHIFFVVRNDISGSEILFQTSDTTWQAYNSYGGNSFYVGGPGNNPGRAYKISYNRPFNTRDASPEDFVFNAEYPMVRWLERNGYDVSYTSGIDTDLRPEELLEHRVFLSVGHDEYWSGDQRTNVEAARDAGVHLAFLSGNEVYWKTRWEPSADGSNTPHRTLVSYKETHADAMIDPAATTWTGTWRDARFSPPKDGGRPEHGLTGQLFRVNDGNTTSIVVPSAEGKMRLWRNTSIATLAAGASATLPIGTLGYEWDEAPTDSFTPAGLIKLSATTRSVNSMLLDNGSTFGAGTATHNLTMYRHPSGALVFGAGTVQWSWGLDNNHDRGNTAADARMKQAMVNLFADMSTQAETLEAGLVSATTSSDLLAPITTITSPAPSSISAGTLITISGTVTEAGGGIVAGVEVSTDGGTTWNRATGTTSWSRSWTVSGSGTVNIMARAFDDSGNMESPGANVAITVTAGQACPCTIWAPTTVPPAPVDDGDAAAVEVGTRFRSDVAGYITGIRFYKAPANTGIHTGRIWTNTGALLATVTFTGETASGWQQMALPNAVPIAANTTYVVSYHAPNGHYTGTDNYFTNSLDRPPLHGLRDGVDGSNGVYRYGAGGVFPTDTYFSEAYWADVVFDTVAPPDSTAPTITSVFPVTGSTGVNPGTTVTATFNEAMDPATISSSTTGVGEGGAALGTFELRGPTNNLINATVTYDTVTRVAVLDPDQALAVSTTYTATMKGGTTDPRVKDLAGNALATTTTWTFTTAASAPPPPTCPCSIWAPTTVPGKIDDGDPNSVELGTRFRSSVAGFITGARYYKGPSNTGTHIAKLWTNAGSLLGTATFTGETASGWQETTFPTAIPISANTTYLISYHANNGHYSSQAQYFATNAVTNGPLTALRDGTDGANGVYQYGTSTFPTQTWQSEGYFVDVVFNTTNGPDVTAPLVASATPVVGVSGIPITTNVRATFNEAMNATTINTNTFQLRDSANNLVPAALTYDTSTRTATLDPTSPLQYLTLYTATVKGGTTDPRVKDTAGNALASDHVWSFTTAAPPPPPPTEGPGGPVLIVTSSANPFTTYLAEILRTEGLNAFTTADLTTVNAGTLTSYDVVILGEMPLTTGQATMFSDWVTQGGNLIAMRPDKKLAPMLGLTDVGTTLAEAYLLVNTATAPGAGIVNQTIQFHGTADRYTLNGATAVATLYSTTTTATTHPAVTTRTVGNGNAVAFTYDLARSVVLTRQGNPAWSGQERDGIAPIRSDDLFYGARTGDIQPDYVNLNKAAIPQADEQQRLLWNIILKINAAKKPLPRFWYFPRMLKAVVIMTGDDHANGGTAGRFDQYMALSAPGCSVADWGCIRGTSYIFPGTPLDPSAVANYVAQGFEIGLHVNTQCADYTPASIASFFSTQLAQFAAGYPQVPPPTTNRTHCIAWSDYTSQAQTSFNNGIRFDTNYYYWPGPWVADRPGMFTGSGMPMRFATSTGQMIDVYQSATQMTDESDMTYGFHADTLLDKALGAEGYYIALNANMHTDFNPSAGQAGSDAILASAQARAVPVISARQMLEWLDGRNGSSFESITWNGSNLLEFAVAVGAGANGLHAMVPATANGSPVVSLALNGQSVAFSLQTIKGQQYAVFAALSGNYQVSYGVDAVAPLITAVSASPSASSAVVQWTTNEASDSRVDYGTSPAALTLSVTNTSDVTAHSLVLPNLAAGTTYYYRVTSADAANNASTSPVVAQAPLTFATTAPSISIGDASVTEGNGGTTTATFTLTLSAPAAQTVTVNYATAAGTATAGTDFIAASGTATFIAGATSTPVAVSVIGDTVFEGAESFAVNLSGAVNATIADAQGSGTIINDDAVPSLSITDVSITEGNAGTVTATLTVSASASSSQTMTVNYATANGTASSGTDYVAASGTLTFAAGVTSRPINLTVNGDTLSEAVETVMVNLSTAVNASIADAQGVASINDDDPVPSIAISDRTVTEGNAGTVTAAFTLTLSAASGQAVSVAYATADGTATAGSDYVAAGGTATFSAGTTTMTINVTVNGDATLEVDETFVVNLSAPVNTAIADGQAVGTIVNDEGIPTASIGDVSIAEGNAGNSTATVTVTLSSAAAQTVTIDYATASGTATVAGGDYTPASGTLTFPVGVLSQPISVTIAGDAVDEPNETFVVNLSSPVNATLADSQATVTITDDDPTPVLTISDVSLGEGTVNEGNGGTVTATFTVSLSGMSSSTVTASYATANGTATAGTDYVAGSGTVTFAPGFLTPQMVSVTVSSDVLDEVDETFVVNLTSPVNATIGDAQGSAIITDDDAEPAIAIADVTLTEGNSGTKLAAFTLTLSAPSGKIVTATYATANVSATAGTDYVAATGTATFNPGATSTVVNVTINGDTGFELDETFQLNLSAPVNASLADAQAIGSITNDDVLPTFSIGDVAVAEGNTGSANAIVTVTASAPSGQTMTVAFATANGTATAGSDYVAASGTLTFNPGVISQTITISVTGDATTESNETVLVNLTSPVNATVLDGQGVVTINNDDGAPTAGLVAAYGFNENAGTTTADASGNNLTGTIAGATWTTAGKNGNALSFDGLNDMVTIADNAALDVTRVTLMGWVRPTALNNWRTAILKESTNGLAYALYAEDNASRPAGYVNLGANDREAKGTTALPTNTWSHIAMTFDGTAMRVYQNGLLVRTVNFTGNIITTNNALRIGGNAIWNDEFFAGQIDDVRVYNRALSLAEIQAGMNTPVTP